MVEAHRHDALRLLLDLEAQVEVAVGVDAVKELHLAGLDVKPGMQAEVLVQTGERTLMNYLLKPLTSRLRGAMKEE